MGSGSWTSSSFASYTTSSKGVSVDDFMNTSYRAQDLYKSRRLSSVLDPKNVMRECCDSDEHPNTLPVILALDVTGSMGGSSVKVAQKLNEIMTALYSDGDVPDIEFCVMGLGDLMYDDAPIQMSQFESDIRVAEQLDAIYFEAGGGGNDFESYTAAWYMGVNHCKLDCWNRGQKGIIITMGDELPNPYLPKTGRYGGGLAAVTGDKLQGDVETKDLLVKTLEKFDVYHISVNDSESSYSWNNSRGELDKQWKDLIGADHYSVATLNNLAKTIVEIIKGRTTTAGGIQVNVTENGAEVTW